jgi:hypothetical protein
MVQLVEVKSMGVIEAICLVVLGIAALAGLG